MAKQGFRPDRGGISRILKAQAAGPINELAEKIAEGVRADLAGEDPENAVVEVQSYTTDRGAASVTIASPLGLQFQATRGSLSKAAAALGLDVKAK